MCLKCSVTDIVGMKLKVRKINPIYAILNAVTLIALV
jgi:hypothetical protein